MKNAALVASVLLLAACASTGDGGGAEPVIVTQPVADPALAQNVAALQVQLMTGQAAPLEAMRAALGIRG